jgi:quercetin dioxygenase-like cupin family protein
MQVPSDNVVQIGALELRFAVDQPSIVMFEFIVPANARVPAPHHHQEVDEIVYGLAGTLMTRIGGETHAIGPGDVRFIRRGSVHHHENLASETARVLIVMTPGSIGRRYFEEVAAEVNVPGKPDLAKVKDIMLRHGLVPA